MSEAVMEETTDVAPPMPQLPEFFLLPGNLAQALLSYLSEQPYKDVAYLADGLRGMAIFEEAPAPNRKTRRTVQK